MNKLLLIPRAIADLFSIWRRPLTWKEKSSFTYTIGWLKLKKWLGRQDEVIAFPLLGRRWHGCNNETLQFLVREIFLEKAYAVSLPASREPLRILDAGSNIGLSVLFFKTVFPDAVIEAYEPDPYSFSLLQQNIAANKLEQVHLVRGAISHTNEMLFAEEGFGPCSQSQRFSPVANSKAPVPAFRLSTLLREKDVDLVKLDIEGAELKVLQDVLEHNCLAKATCWLIEFHHETSDTAPIVTAFEQNGFTASRTQDVYCFTKIRNHKY